jgi:hypothetical protein
MKTWKNLTIEKRAFAVLFAVIVVFSISRFLPIIEGARFSSGDLKNGTTVSDTFSLSGKTKNTKELYINNNPIPIDQKGNWKTAIGLPPGYTVVTVEAYDKFGKSNKKTYQLLVEKESNSPPIGINDKRDTSTMDSPPNLSEVQNIN